MNIHNNRKVWDMYEDGDLEFAKINSTVSIKRSFGFHRQTPLHTGTV